MSPVYDDRWSEARKREGLELDRGDPGRPWLVPLIMLLVGGAIMLAATMSHATDVNDEWPVAVHLAAYPVMLAIEVVFGVIGLWVAAKLWLGGAGTLGMAVLRLAAIYAVVDVVWLLVSPLLWVGWILYGTVYVGLLMWQFELEVADAIILGLITWGLKFGAGIIIGVALLSSM